MRIPGPEIQVVAAYVVFRVGEDTFEIYLRYRNMIGCIFCIF